MKNLKSAKTSKANIEGINRYTLITEESKKGMTVYIIEPSGQRHCLMCHRPNWPLQTTFKDGITLGEIHRMKPSRKGSEQAVLHSAKHIARVAEEFIRYELPTYPMAA